MFVALVCAHLEREDRAAVDAGCLPQSPRRQLPEHPRAQQVPHALQRQLVQEQQDAPQVAAEEDINGY